MAGSKTNKLSQSVSAYLLEKLADAVQNDIRYRTYRGEFTGVERVASDNVRNVYAEVRAAQGRE